MPSKLGISIGNQKINDILVIGWGAIAEGVDISMLWEIIRLISSRVAALVLESIPTESFPSTSTSDLSMS
jgi:hypothetical protein